MNPEQNETKTIKNDDVKPTIYNRPYNEDDIIHAFVSPPEEPLPQFNVSKLNAKYEDRLTPKR